MKLSKGKARTLACPGTKLTMKALPNLPRRMFPSATTEICMYFTVLPLTRAQHVE
jgi:hypothetical protein